MPVVGFCQDGVPLPCDPDENPDGCDVSQCDDIEGCNTPLDTWVWVLVLVSGLYTVIYMTRDKSKPPTPDVPVNTTHRKYD